MRILCGRLPTLRQGGRRERERAQKDEQSHQLLGRVTGKAFKQTRGEQFAVDRRHEARAAGLPQRRQRKQFRPPPAPPLQRPYRNVQRGADPRRREG